MDKTLKSCTPGKHNFREGQAQTKTTEEPQKNEVPASECHTLHVKLMFSGPDHITHLCS